MNGTVAEFLVDTDVFVDHLRGFRELKSGRRRISYSVVTRCELFSGLESDEEAVGLLLAAFREVPVDRAIAERAGRLRRETRVRVPDALIAATAIEHRLTLVTRNLRDFESLPRLKVRAPE